MGRRRIATSALAAAVVTACAGCSTDGAPGASPEPSITTTSTPPTTTASPTTTSTAPSPGARTTSAPATTTRPPDALAFFRAQEGPCREFARQMGGTVGVEPERFRDATVVRDLGNGATQIRDGHGTRLVVVPRRGIVLPASGRADDVMPPPYEFGCSEKVFVGASHD